MANLNFSFTPGAGYTAPYTIVAYGNTNTSIPIGQVTVSGYGVTVTGAVTTSSTDRPYLLKMYTNVCEEAVGELILT